MRQRHAHVSIRRSKEHWLRLNHWWCAWQAARARKKWNQCLQEPVDLLAASAWYQASLWWGQRRVEIRLLLKALKENESKTEPITANW